jgi:hypothetical protein
MGLVPQQIAPGTNCSHYRLKLVPYSRPRQWKNGKIETKREKRTRDNVYREYKQK